MKDINDIKDDQIRVLGDTVKEKSFFQKHRKSIVITSVALVLVILLLIFFYFLTLFAPAAEEVAGEPVLTEEEVEEVQEPEKPAVILPLGKAADASAEAFTEIKDTIINDIPIRLFIPHNAEMSLRLGRVSKSDKSIVYAAQAADVRADNGGIVGAFVLKGTPKSWGLSKKGFCANIDGVITIGVAENSPLFEEATEKGGYFFRQYPLVSNGRIVENVLKGKSIRRGICDRNGEIFMVETLTSESFHDFSQALVDLYVDNAIYLVGSSAYGWAVDEEGKCHEFGKNVFIGRHRKKAAISYIVWTKTTEKPSKPESEK